MPIMPSGEFVFTIKTEDLAKGLRPSKRIPRDAKFMAECAGAVGIDGVLSTIPQLNPYRIDDPALVGVTFPYPQVWVFTNLIIVATRSAVYEWTGGALVLGIDITGSEGNSLWSAIDLYDYVYMSNTRVSIRRRASDRLWELAPTLPTANAICNYNGQVFIGAPDIAL